MLLEDSKKLIAARQKIAEQKKSEELREKIQAIAKRKTGKRMKKISKKQTGEK
jgi:hypothetical protein